MIAFHIPRADLPSTPPPSKPTGSKEVISCRSRLRDKQKNQNSSFSMAGKPRQDQLLLSSVLTNTIPPIVTSSVIYFFNELFTRAFLAFVSCMRYAILLLLILRFEMHMCYITSSRLIFLLPRHFNLFAWLSNLFSCRIC